MALGNASLSEPRVERKDRRRHHFHPRRSGRVSHLVCQRLCAVGRKSRGKWDGPRSNGGLSWGQLEEVQKVISLSLHSPFAIRVHDVQRNDHGVEYTRDSELAFLSRSLLRLVTMGVHGLATYLRENQRTLSTPLVLSQEQSKSKPALPLVIDGWSCVRLIDVLCKCHR